MEAFLLPFKDRLAEVGLEDFFEKMLCQLSVVLPALLMEGRRLPLVHPSFQPWFEQDK